MDENNDKLWRNYWKCRDNDSINDLINAYIHLIVSIAEDVISEHPNRVPIDDLYPAGIFALKDCIVDYAKDCPTNFEVFCGDKIKQAMLEELEYWQANQKPNK